MHAEPMTPEQVEELRRAVEAYDRERERPYPPSIPGLLDQYMADFGRAQDRLVNALMLSRHALIASLDHRETMLRRMDKHAPAGGEREIIYFNRPI